MHKDEREALRRLEAELLMEEPEQERSLEDELAEVRALLGDTEEEESGYRNFSNGYGGTGPVYVDTDDRIDHDEYITEVNRKERTSNIRVLIAIALALLGGIFGMLAYWVIRYL